MQTFNEFLEKLYINEAAELASALQQNSNDDVSGETNYDGSQKNVNMLSDDLIVSSNLQKIKRIILVGVEFTKSIQMLKNDGYIVEFINSEDFESNISNNHISVKSGKNNIEISSENAVDTCVLVRSGYTKPIVAGMLKYCEELGILVVNGVNQVKISSDKFLTAELLSKYNISQPKYCLITSEDIDKEDTKKAEKKIKALYDKVTDDTKYVCKILNGHGGRGVFICRKFNIMSILQCIFAIDHKCPILVQEFGKLKDGDIRVHVISLNGQQIIVDSIIRLKSNDDFRTNLSLGNKMDAYKLSPEQEQLALDAAKASGLIWCGVDIMPLENGDNKIVEFNGAPGPASNIDDADIVTVNYKFYKKIISTINSLCQH